MTVHHARAAPDKVAAGERSTLRAVAIPTEHGGWSLTLEPVAAVRAAPRPAKIIGFQQMFFGLAAVIVTAIAVLA